MLSVLIPTFNYNSLTLVEVIQKQCIKARIIFEIICQDDASNSELNAENEMINSLPHCYFFTNSVNLGRGRNINSMASKAKYDYILLVDCDTLPAQEDFIQNYINEIKKEKLVVFGGIIYQVEKPKQKNLLRWVYGQNREAIPVEQRRKKPYFSTLTSNILVKKEVFLSNLFDANITNYGYEDVVFVKNLMLKCIPIQHIDNPTFHLNLETSTVFMKKVRESLESLRLISDLKLLNDDDNRILKTYKVLKMLCLHQFISALFTYNKSKLEKNLVSNNPKMFVLDLYKLGYFCQLFS